MHRNYIKVPFRALLIIACVFFQSCKDQETITAQEDEVIENNNVLQKIKSLGFAENQIKEMPNYYLADGDLYFSKKTSSDDTAPVIKPKPRVLEKYTTLTIHVDESLADATNDHWRVGIDQAIAEWNANEEVHFHFAVTNSADANINIIEDTDLPKDLAIASEFARDGRAGSSIRINVDATNVVKDTKQALAHALEHCVGFLHSTSLKNKNVKTNSNALKGARGPRFDLELYAIQGDVLYRVDGNTGEYYAMGEGWAGSDLIAQWHGMLLYIVQFGTLYAVYPSTGEYTALTNGWEGSQYITSVDDKLYIMQDSKIWPVALFTGLWDESIGRYTLARGLVGYADPYDNDKYKLAVLKRKAGSSTVSILYTIDPSNGNIDTQTTVPASGVSDWNGKFLLARRSNDLVVFNGTHSFINGGDGQYTHSYGARPSVAVVAPYHPSYIYYITDDGTLYMIIQKMGYHVTRRSNRGDWVDTSCMVYLDK